MKNACLYQDEGRSDDKKEQENEFYQFLEGHEKYLQEEINHQYEKEIEKNKNNIQAQLTN